MTLTPRAEVGRRVVASGLRAPALLGAAGLGAAVLLHLRDPHDSGSYGYCPFLTLTGKPCPGCGSLRAVNDLTRGDVVGALSSNLLAVVLVGALAAAWVLWVVRRVRGKVDSMITLTLPAGLALIAVILAFGVVRNTPWGSWLAP
ncbi:DUF2752 domain-containing protein [Aeromicrobium sp. Root344]|uniref:DUF2752 domain-containing protein n=1 Tax=Aeromicrobium sp. Root344 TaxID=1736521 RepID=UPI0009E76E37|nr:DUF2752 domain-containing protein [Aeromicrobium sp. Root344]